MYPFLVENVEEASVGLTKEARIVLNGLALSRCVDDAEHLLQMILYQLHQIIIAAK